MNQSIRAPKSIEEIIAMRDSLANAIAKSVRAHLNSMEVDRSTIDPSGPDSCAHDYESAGLCSECGNTSVPVNMNDPSNWKAGDKVVFTGLFFGDRPEMITDISAGSFGGYRVTIGSIDGGFSVTSDASNLEWHSRPEKNQGENQGVLNALDQLGQAANIFLAAKQALQGYNTKRAPLPDHWPIEAEWPGVNGKEFLIYAASVVKTINDHLQLDLVDIENL